MKTKRTYQSGRSIHGWAYGPRIRDIRQIRVGDYLLGDSHHFQATNLYRVTKIVRDSGETMPSRFLVIYVHPNRRKTGENASMCVWYGELDPPNYSYYRAQRLEKNARRSNRRRYSFPFVGVEKVLAVKNNWRSFSHEKKLFAGDRRTALPQSAPVAVRIARRRLA